MTSSLDENYAKAYGHKAGFGNSPALSWAGDSKMATADRGDCCVAQPAPPATHANPFDWTWLSSDPTGRSVVCFVTLSS